MRTLLLGILLGLVKVAFAIDDPGRILSTTELDNWLRMLQLCDGAGCLDCDFETGTCNQCYEGYWWDEEEGICKHNEMDWTEFLICVGAVALIVTGVIIAIRCH